MVERQPLFISACLKRFFVVTQACEPTPYISTWTAGSQAASGVKQKIRLAGSALSWQIMKSEVPTLSHKKATGWGTRVSPALLTLLRENYLRRRVCDRNEQDF